MERCLPNYVRIHHSLWFTLKETADILQSLAVEGFVSLLRNIAEMRCEEEVIKR